jgi:hypothetical protein
MSEPLHTAELLALLEAHSGELASMQHVTGWGIGTGKSGALVHVFASGDLGAPTLRRLDRMFHGRFAVVGVDRAADAH